MTEPFRKMNLRESPDTFTVRFNEAERAEFDKVKNLIEQPKDSTAIKQLAWIGIKKVLHDPSTAYAIHTLFKNKAKNKRLGIVEFED